MTINQRPLELQLLQAGQGLWIPDASRACHLPGRQCMGVTLLGCAGSGEPGLLQGGDQQPDRSAASCFSCVPRSRKIFMWAVPCLSCVRRHVSHV